MLLPIVRAQWISLYLLIFGFSGFILFLYGFFPLKYHGGTESDWDDLPNEINGIRVDGKKIYMGNRTKVVLMVIDALRYDFVNTEYMPFTSSMISKGEACLYKARAEPPTVTMPRIKAMTTGSISNFIDVALNFGSAAVTDDSFLNQAKLNDKTMVFYGDDTWLKLFPETFTTSEGTTSFFVTDYTEVDLKVTKNLRRELSPKKTNWDLMVLHYLGLDHIGHLEGPSSPKVLPKMLEMDRIVESIMMAFKNWEDDTVLIICGDHGMKDSGSHGGASHSEVTVPLVITQSRGCSQKLVQDVDQIDLAPTISFLLGVPIPSVSTGQILSQVLSNGSSGDLNSERALYTLYYNAKINSDALLKILGEDEARNKECFKRFLAATKHHEDWLKSSKKDINSIKTAVSFYRDSMSNMAHYLTKSLVEYDMYAIILGIILILQTFIAQILVMIVTFKSDNTNKQYSNIYSYKKQAMVSRVILIIFVIIACSFIFKVICGVSQTNSSICKLNPVSITAIISVIGIIVTNAVIIQNVQNNLPELDGISFFNVIEGFLIIGTVIHPFTYGGTSFIEEEHQTWYFFWTSLTCLILLYTGRVLLEYYHKKKENATEVQDKESLSAKMDKTAKILLPQWIFLMVIHRFLRTLNQTGDKWAFLPDISDWLHKDENYEILSVLSLASLFSTTIICQNNLQKTIVPYKTNCLLIIASTLSIFFYRVTTLSVQIPILGQIDLGYNEIYVVRIFWLLIFFIFVIEAISSRYYFANELNFIIFKMNKDKSLNIGRFNDSFVDNEQILMENLNAGFLLSDQSATSLTMKLLSSRITVFLNIILLVCSLYLRPHNQMLVPCMFFTSNLINKILDFKFDTINYNSNKNCSRNVLCKTLAHFWIGTVFYFYQGNSNSLASVDLGAGYIGLETYMPIIVALQLGVHTFAGPLLATTLLFANLVQENHDWNIFIKYFKVCISTIVPLRLYSLLIYTIICTIFRYHLFVWTVFSPKLLYEFMLTFYSICVIIIIVLCCLSIKFQENIYVKNASRQNFKIVKELHDT